MSIETMSDTAYLFILAGVWSLIALAIVWFVPKWSAKIVVFALLVGIPFWELPYGYYNFQKLCRDEGRMQVFASIGPQRSICADYPFDYSAQNLVRFGFESVEARAKSGEVTRFSKAAQGVRPLEKSTKIASEFCVKSANNNHLPWRVIRHDFLIIRSRDETVVARHSVFDWFGMWWQAAAAPVLGRGGECREDPVGPVMATLLSGSK